MVANGLVISGGGRADRTFEHERAVHAVQCAKRFAWLQQLALGTGESLELITEAAADL